MSSGRGLQSPPPCQMHYRPDRFDLKFIMTGDMTISRRVKLIHINIVRYSLAALERSKLTDSASPDINDEELGFPRKTRVNLARLRSSWHPRLEDHIHRIGTLRSPKCCRCHTSVGDVKHFPLYCPTLTKLSRKHSNTTLLDLSTNPLKVSYGGLH